MLSDLERLRNAIDTGDAKYYSGDIKRGLVWALNDLIERTEDGDEDILLEGCNAAETTATLKSENEASRSIINKIEEAAMGLTDIMGGVDGLISKASEIQDDR